MIKDERTDTTISSNLGTVIYSPEDCAPMSPASEPMTFDELSELYRVEMKSSSITQVRGDLFRAMAELLTRLRIDFDKQMSIDPESVMCEGANQRRKKAERLVKDIMHIRTQKICQMAIRGALGAENQLDALTTEERSYYTSIQDESRRHLSEIDRLRGRRNTVATHIDEVPEPRREPEPVPEERRIPEPEPVVVESVPEHVSEPVIEEDIPPEMEQDMFDEFPPEESFDDIPDEPPMEPETFEEPEPVVEQVTPTETVPEARDDDLTSVILRILEDLPPFVGPDRDYELSKEDIVTIPKVMAEALVNSGKAEYVRPTP